jgi:hypothetical protein
MKKIFLLQSLFLFLFAGTISGQVVLGSDTSQHIQVTTSSNYHPLYWTQSATGDKTINGVGLEGPIMEASRFFISSHSWGGFGKRLNMLLTRA